MPLPLYPYPPSFASWSTVLLCSIGSTVLYQSNQFGFAVPEIDLPTPPLPESLGSAGLCYMNEYEVGDVRGLNFVGLSLSRNAWPEIETSNNASVTRQTQFDFNGIQDRAYDYLCETNDDGWLVGGGEGGDRSYVLHNPDSAHIEVVHVGSGSSETGGMTEREIVEVMQRISFKPIRLKPSYVRFNSNDPPEFEVKWLPGEMLGQASIHILFY